jgi:glycosidase
MRLLLILMVIAFLSLILAEGIKCQVSTGKTKVKHPSWSDGAVIYELNTRQFTPEGTFRAIMPRIAELKKLGVGIVWFMPIHPVGIEGRKGSLGSPYAVRDFGAINPEFGTMEDFKALVDAFHEQGIRVIIDLVANHTSWDNQLVREHPEWFAKDAKGKIIPPVPDWSDVAQLDYRQQGLRSYMLGIMEFWVRDVGIDGFRCDVASRVPTGFWNEARRKLDAIKPVFMLAEAEKPELLIEAFDCDYASEYYRAFNAIAEGKEGAARIDALITADARAYPAGSFRMHFTDNHDQNSWHAPAITRLGPEGAKVFALLTFTLPGKPLIYDGQEIGSVQKLEFFEKDPIQWGESSMRPFYTRLCALYRDNPALWRGTMNRLATPDNPEVFAFIREAMGSAPLLIVTNLSPKETKISLPLTNTSTSPLEILEDRAFQLTGSRLTLELKPWGYHVFQLK